ncbi:MAG: 2-methylaconitate cis-trans isomerase PrpF [Candidatus Pelagadaptatus aseana]|uniref:2-methylaconitate cis-trans isomerase PrpF n=1 Tax=Candidatus Pelagadaptatus aseana TaxID=3120508 RepID=UPI0039B26441
MPNQLRIPATYMRGGTSKGLFFRLEDLPSSAQSAGPERDRLLQRIMGSPDPYGKQIDGMGGATSSTSKVAILSPSQQPGHHVDYLFGQIGIDQPLVDWSGNCGNLTAAAAVFAINSGLIDAQTIPENGELEVRIWQQNIGKSILARVPMADGQPLEQGDFYIDGVAFPGAKISLTFLHPGDSENALFPSGNPMDSLAVPTAINPRGRIDATLINSGIAAVIIDARQINLSATEQEQDLLNQPSRLQQLEIIRTQAAMQMGLISSAEQARERQHTPKIIWLNHPQTYLASSGREINAAEIDLCARALSMGRLHHAMMASAVVALGSAANIPGTLVAQLLGGTRDKLTLGHPSGSVSIGTSASRNQQGHWCIDQATLERSARVIMEGWVRVTIG